MPSSPAVDSATRQALSRKEERLWSFLVLLVVLLAITVVIQLVAMGEQLQGLLSSDSSYRRVLGLGLAGLTIIFALYTTLKRREIAVLKSTLFDQQTLLARLEERQIQLSLALQELKRVGTMKDILLSTVSHELRTPLASMKAMAELLLACEAKDPGERENFYQLIVEESRRLSELVNNLLDFEMIKSGKMTWNLGQHRPADIIRSAVAGIKGLALRREIDITEEFTDDLPSVTVDRDRIIQVLTNLMGNAIKFSPKGESITLEARIISEGKSGKAISISIRDKGPGIAENERHRIFDWMHTIHNTNGNQATGSGLGLSISREIVEYSGGRIWVESSGGTGSTFIFTIPVTESIEVTPAARTTSAAHPQSLSCK